MLGSSEKLRGVVGDDVGEDGEDGGERRGRQVESGWAAIGRGGARVKTARVDVLVVAVEDEELAVAACAPFAFVGAAACGRRRDDLDAGVLLVVRVEDEDGLALVLGVEVGLEAGRAGAGAFGLRRHVGRRVGEEERGRGGALVRTACAGGGRGGCGFRRVEEVDEGTEGG